MPRSLVGKPIEVGAAISKSVDIVSKNPVILLPQLAVLVLTLLGDLVAGSSLGALRLVITVVTAVVGVIVAGAYPSMVKAIVEGGTPSVSDALGKAYHRFWTLLGAGILVVLLVGLGLIALVVPGIILATWYAYAIPAIMLEEKGALEGMAASKTFGRDKKWSTFLTFVAFAVGGVVIAIVQLLFSIASPVAGQAVYAILEVPLAAWVSVVLSYTYITHGPSSGPWTAPPAPTLPPLVQSRAFVGPPLSIQFCPSCGSPVTQESKFCSNCGKPL